MTRLSRTILLLTCLINATWVDGLFAKDSPTASVHVDDKGKLIVRGDGDFIVAAINRGRSSGFVEGRALEIRRPVGGQERVIGFAKVTAAEQDYSFIVVESPPGLTLTKDDRFVISQAEPGALGFKFMSSEGLKRSPTFISFFGNDRLLLISNQDEFMIWDWRRGQKVQSVPNWRGVYFSAFSINKLTNRLHVLGSPAVYEWDLNKMEITKSLPIKDQGPFPILAEARDGRVIAHTASRGEAIILDADLKEVGRFGVDKNLGDMSHQADLSPDGTLFLTVHTRLEFGGAGGLKSPRSVLLWDTKTRKFIRKLAEQTRDPTLVRFVPPNNSVAYDTDDGRLMFVSASGEPIASTPLGENGITGLAFSPSGSLFVTTNRIGEIKLWNYPSLESRVIARDGVSGANPLAAPIAFSSDGNSVSAGLADNAVGIWDVATGKLLRRIEGASQDVANIMVSKDSKHLIVAGRRTVETWALDGAGMSARSVPDIKFAALGAVSGRMMSVGRAEKKKYFSPIPGFDPENLTLSIWDGTKRSEIATWGAREVEDYAITPDEKYFVRADVFNISIWSLTDGSLVHSRPVVNNEEYGQPSFKKDTGNSLLVGKVQISSDGHAIAFGRDDGLLRIWEFDSGKIGKDLYTTKFEGIDAFAISPDFNTIVAASGSGKLLVVDRQSGKTRYELQKPGIRVEKIVWDPQATKFAVVASNRLHVYASSDGTGLYSKQFISSVGDIGFSPDGVFLFVGSSGGQTHVLRASSGARIAQLVTQQSNSAQKPADGIGERARQLVSQVVCYVECGANDSNEIRPRWLALTEESRFDTDGFWDDSEFSWVAADNPLVPIAPEVFMRDYYEPRLLPRLLACHEAEAHGYDAAGCKMTFKPVRSLAALSRVQPKVKIASVKQGNSPNEALVEVEVTRGVDGSQRNGKTETGPYDLRLFRDGQLVGRFPQTLGDVSESDNIEAWRKQSLAIPTSGQTQARIPFKVDLASRNKGAPVHFTAYAFNEDRVKSGTDSYDEYTVPRDVERRVPRAYIVSMGVSAYQNPKWHLSFAAKDAQDMSAALQNIEGYQVVSVPLISSDENAPMDHGTKANVRDVLNALGGDLAARDRLKNSLGSAARPLTKATPDDVVIISFSGHGYTDPQGHFYLLPSDSGPDGVVDKDRLLKFVSSDELSQWLRSIDAGQVVFIIDACHSAASVPLGFKPGPMGDRGLGQLAYDKGMRLLAATQADDIALESKKLGQGLLTYALVQEGLKARKASAGRDDPITVRAWLGYAESRVPTLYNEILSGQLKAVRMVDGSAKDLAARDSEADLKFIADLAQHAQTPAFFDFYRSKTDPILKVQ